MAVVLPDGKRKVARCAFRQAASDRLRQFLADREEGRLVAGPRLMVEQFAKRWLDEIVKPNLRPAGTSRTRGASGRTCSQRSAADPAGSYLAPGCSGCTPIRPRRACHSGL